MWTWDSNFYDKNSPFLPGCTFKLAGKNWIEGSPGPVVFNIVVSYCCKRKMLKRNWRNNRLFCHIFVIGKILIEGDPGPLSPPPRLGYAYAPSEKNIKSLRKFSARFLAFSNEISTSKNSAVLEPRTGQFSRTWGFEPRTWPSKPRPRTSKCVLEAKNVHEDSTSARYCSRIRSPMSVVRIS